MAADRAQPEVKACVLGAQADIPFDIIENQKL